MNPSPLPPPPAAPPPAHPEQELLRAIREMAFGTVEVTVHQSRIVQITRSEKVRFDPR
ncbi:MAG: DUF2292 domain-containing protein [Lysobacteraceae bacterium]